MKNVIKVPDVKVKNYIIIKKHKNPSGSSKEKNYLLNYVTIFVLDEIISYLSFVLRTK